MFEYFDQLESICQVFEIYKTQKMTIFVRMGQFARAISRPPPVQTGSSVRTGSSVSHVRIFGQLRSISDYHIIDMLVIYHDF